MSRVDSRSETRDSEARLARALEGYLAALELGRAPPRDEFLARHPELADDLETCLAGVGLLRRARREAGLAGGAGRLGDFRLLREIGRGGMGVVFEAEQESLGRRVAVKVLPFAATLDGRQLQRFHNEARAAAGLHHPHVVSVYAVGEDQGVHFYAMQLVEGWTLAQLIAGRRRAAGLDADGTEGLSGPPTEAWGPPPPGTGDRRQSESLLLPADGRAYEEAVAALGAQAAEALHHAHELGIVHRDVKPANLMVDARLHLWVTDFGLARVDVDSSLTGTGDVLGTLRYMSPEQALGRKGVVDQRSDVYSLGATLYELLTLRPAFPASDRRELMRQIAEAEPLRPRRFVRWASAELETVILKALARKPEDRYATARELADDLRRFLAGRPVLARPIGRASRAVRWCLRHPAPAGLVALVAAVLLVVPPLLLGYEWLLGEARVKAALSDQAAEAERQARSSAERAARAEEFYRLLAQARERRLRLAPGWTWDNERDLARAATLAPSAADLAELRAEVAACAAATDLRPVRTVAPGFTALQAAFTPDGRRLVLAQAVSQGPTMRVLLIDPDAGRVETELTYPSAEGWQLKSGRAEATKSLTISPDGRWLVLGMRSGHLHRWDLTQPAAEAVTWPGHADAVHRLAFSSDGRWLFSLSWEGTLRRWAVAEGWREAPADRLPSGADDLAVLPLRKLLALRFGGELKFLDEETLLATYPYTHAAPARAFSPTGFVGVTEEGRSLALRSLYSQSDVFARMSVAAGEDQDIERAVFSADGRLLARAFGSTRRLKVWESAGGRRVADLVVPGGLDAAAFRPDGRLLAVAAEGRTDLYEVAGQHEQTIAAEAVGPVWDLDFLGDGRTLACFAGLPGDDFGQNGITFVPTTSEGSAPSFPAWFTPAVDNNTPPRLAVHPTGSHVFVSAGRAGRVRCWDTVTGRESYWDSGEAEVKDLAVAPDGRVWAAAGNAVLSGHAPREPLAPRYANDEAARAAGSVFYSVAAGRRWALAGRRDGRVFLFDSTAGRLERALRVCDSPVLCIALDPGEGLAAVGTQAGKVSLLDVPSGRVVRELPAHRDSVTAVGFLGPDLLASASRDGSVRLVRRDGEVVLTLPTPGAVERMAVSPTGTRLAVVVENERAARVWHLDRLARRLERAGLGTDLPREATPGEGLTADPLAPPRSEPPEGVHGLRGELFAGPHFERKLGERIVSNVDLAIDEDQTFSGLPVGPHTVRLTGWVKAPAPGGYVFSLRYDNGIRVWLDGRLLLDRWPGGPEDVFEVSLTDRPHAFRLEFLNVNGPAHYTLRWRPAAGDVWEVVPAEAFFHERAAAEKASGR